MRKVFGILALALGVLGFFLPILPGSLFVLAGLALMKGRQKIAAAC
jgi:uncharacterized membrane protein YbaN (DUF454 family)